MTMPGASARIAAAVAFGAGVVLPLTAAGQDAERTWSVSGFDRSIVATDCTDCGDDIGLMLECAEDGAYAKATVYWAATGRGRDGASAPFRISVDGQDFTYEATARDYAAVGFTPEFRIYPGDPLIEALSAGHVADVEFAGQANVISLRGSRRALSTFAAQCGWTAAAGQQAGGNAAAPAEAGPPARTDPEPDLHRWFNGQYQNAENGRPAVSLTYGIPETGDVALSATCESGASPAAVSVALLLDPGDLGPGSDAEVHVRTDRIGVAYRGEVFEDSSEFSGALIALSPADPVWSELAASTVLEFSIAGEAPVQVPLNGFAEAAAPFLQSCQAMLSAAPAAAPVVAAPPPQRPPQPAAGLPAGAPSFGPAAGAPSFGPAAGAPAFGSAAGAPSLGPAAGAPSLGPAAGAPSFGPAAGAPSLGPAAGAPSFGTAAAPSFGAPRVGPASPASPQGGTVHLCDDGSRLVTRFDPSGRTVFVADNGQPEIRLEATSAQASSFSNGRNALELKSGVVVFWSATGPRQCRTQ